MGVLTQLDLLHICGRYDSYDSKNRGETNQFTSIDPKAQKHCNVMLHSNQNGNTKGSEGKKGPRRSHSTKALTSGETCKFHVTIFWDAKGYYIQRGAGHTIHCQHMRCFPKDIPLSVRHWGDSVKREIGQLSKGRITPASLRNYLNREQCHYASKIYNADSERYYFGEQPGAKGLLGYLEKHKEEISYCIWQAHCPYTDVPAIQHTSNIIFQENTLDSKKTFMGLTDMCQDVLQEYQREMELLDLRKDQNYFIACGWITNKERRLFRLFPHVLKVDVVNVVAMRHPEWTVGSLSASLKVLSHAFVEDDFSYALF